MVKGAGLDIQVTGVVSRASSESHEIDIEG